jgi:hypothetical protein
MNELFKAILTAGLTLISVHPETITRRNISQKANKAL